MSHPEPLQERMDLVDRRQGVLIVRQLLCLLRVYGGRFETKLLYQPAVGRTAVVDHLRSGRNMASVSVHDLIPVRDSLAELFGGYVAKGVHSRCDAELVIGEPSDSVSSAVAAQILLRPRKVIFVEDDSAPKLLVGLPFPQDTEYLHKPVFHRGFRYSHAFRYSAQAHETAQVGDEFGPAADRNVAAGERGTAYSGEGVPARLASVPDKAESVFAPPDDVAGTAFRTCPDGNIVHQAGLAGSLNRLVRVLVSVTVLDGDHRFVRGRAFLPVERGTRNNRRIEKALLAHSLVVLSDKEGQPVQGPPRQRNG